MREQLDVACAVRPAPQPPGVDTATIAVISSGTVAVLTIVAADLRDRRSLKHARTLTDLDSVRGVLDEAASSLHETGYALRDVRVGLADYGGAFFEDDDRVKYYEDLGSAGKELDHLLERLKIRFGPAHEVVTTFAAANVAVLESYRTLWGLRRESKPREGDERAQREWHDRVAEQRDRVTAQRELFEAKWEQFIDAAQAVAGADLPKRRG